MGVQIGAQGIPPAAALEEQETELAGDHPASAQSAHSSEEEQYPRGEGEAVWHRLIEHHPDAVYISAGGQILYVNAAGVALLGAPHADAVIGRSILDFVSPGERMIVRRRMREVDAGRPAPPREFDFLRLDGITRVVEVASVPVHFGGRAAIQTVLVDVTERRIAGQAGRIREAVLEASAFTAETLLQHLTWEAGIGQVLKRLGTAVQASRAYLFRNDEHDGYTVARQCFEWAAHGVSSQLGNEELEAVVYRTAGFARWEDELSQGNVLSGLVRELPPDEAELLRMQEIESIAVVPVFVRGAWWGFIGFDECRYERQWTEAEVDALWIAAHTLGGAIRRSEDEQALRQLNEALEQRVANRTEALQRANERLEGRVRQRTAQVRELAMALALTEQKQRRLLAQTLYDDLQQRLFALQLRIHLLQPGLNPEPEEMQADLRHVDALLTGCIETTKDLTVTLSPPVLNGEGLGEALAWLVMHLQKRDGLAITFHPSPLQTPLHDDLRVLLFQIVRDVLDGLAAQVDVPKLVMRLEEKNATLCITIVDEQLPDLSCAEARSDAQEPSAYPFTRHRELLQLFGGDLTVEWRADAGQHVALHLPAEAFQPEPLDDARFS